MFLRIQAALVFFLFGSLISAEAKDLPYFQYLRQLQTPLSEAVDISDSEISSEAPVQTSEVQQERPSDTEDIFRMREFNPNYFVIGEPDTKIQFSFKFRFFAREPLFLGYTQVIFWDLFEDSRPFSDANYNPELFYQVSSPDYFFDRTEFGIAHISNGRGGLDSRSVDYAFLRIFSSSPFFYDQFRLALNFRALFNEDDTNLDIEDFYGPLIARLYFHWIGEKLLRCDEFYFEYYNGGRYAEDFTRSSFRVNLRYKLFKNIAAPKLFIQYFNGYGEGLADYDKRDETYRIGLSLGGD